MTRRILVLQVADSAVDLHATLVSGGWEKFPGPTAARRAKCRMYDNVITPRRRSRARARLFAFAQLPPDGPSREASDDRRIAQTPDYAFIFPAVLTGNAVRSAISAAPKFARSAHGCDVARRAASICLTRCVSRAIRLARLRVHTVKAHDTLKS
jgi:hypothetical protein